MDPQDAKVGGKLFKSLISSPVPVVMLNTTRILAKYMGLIEMQDFLRVGKYSRSAFSTMSCGMS